MKKYSAEKMEAPNWKIESDYDYIKKLSLPQLAFEFLRRNPEYISDYKRYQEIEAKLTKQFGPKDTCRKKWKTDGRSVGMIWDPPRNAEELRRLDMLRGINHPRKPSGYWYEDWAQFNWGLNVSLPSPFEQCDPALEFKTRYGFPVKLQFHEDGPTYHDVTRPHDLHIENITKIVLVFDLEQPVDLQIADAKKLFINEVEQQAEKYGKDFLSSKKTPDFRSKFITYLRVWDGEVANAEKKDVADTIFGEWAGRKSKKDFSDPYNVMLGKRRDTYKSAEEFVLQKYCTIPFYKE